MDLKTALINITGRIDLRHFANGAEREALRRFFDDGLTTDKVTVKKKSNANAKKN